MSHKGDLENQIHLSSPLAFGSSSASKTIEADNFITGQKDSFICLFEYIYYHLLFDKKFQHLKAARISLQSYATYNFGTFMMALLHFFTVRF